MDDAEKTKSQLISELQEMRKQVATLTRPMEDGENIAFEDLFNLADIQHLQDLYAKAFGVAALITRPDGTPITRPSEFTELCSRFIRNTPKGSKNCNTSDAMIGRHNPFGPIIQPCMSAGLCNAGASITVGGCHVANWLIGQVRNEHQSEEKIMDYARKLGADEDAFRAAYQRVPVMSQEQFERVAQVLYTVTRQLSTSAYQNIRQARFIAQLRQAKQALKVNEQLLINILESMDEAVAVFNKDFTFRVLNQKLEAFSGRSRKEMIGKTPWDIFPDIKDARITENLKNAMKGRITSSIETQLINSDQTSLWAKVSHSPLRDENGRIIGVVAVLSDITQQKKNQEELRNLRNYLSNIIDSMPSVLVGVDSQGLVTQWNHKAEQVTGIGFEKAHSKPLVKVFPHLADEMERIQTSIRDHQVIRDSKVLRENLEETRYESITIYPLVANGMEGAVIRVDDVTDQVHMEEMMIQNEKMLSVGGLAAGMAHEINNPLAGMVQTTHVMSQRLSAAANLAPNQKAAQAAGTTIEAIEHYMQTRGILRMLDTITESGERVAQIVSNILSFARKNDSDDSVHDLNKILDKTIALAATDYDLKKEYDFKQIEILREYDNNLPAVPCQDSKIQQVVLNILTNGAQAMQEAGTLKPRFILRTYADPTRDMVCMEIEDNGPGMNKKTLKHIFDPFFTTKPTGVGTGLGLSVSYFIITENHKGELLVESSPDAGAKFIIRLANS
nr:PocR ligand-binding domain-containing protein [uncultured Desulfobacter sp.]